MQQPQLPPSNMAPNGGAPIQPPTPTHERPERKSSKFVRVMRVYLMIAGGAITLYGLGWLLTKGLVLVASWIK